MKRGTARISIIWLKIGEVIRGSDKRISKERKIKC